MTILFFRVEDVLNFPGSESRAPSGRTGIVDRLVKTLKEKLDEQPIGTQLVLYGDWAKDWDFDEKKCTPDGIYLIKKLKRRGMHIMAKTEGENGVSDYLNARRDVEHYKVLA